MENSGAFEEKRLGNLVLFVNGDRGVNYPSVSDYVQNGVPFVSAADIDNGYVTLESTKKISQLAFDRLRSGKTQTGDLLYCLRGSLGKMARVINDENMAIASSLVIIRSTPRIDGKYLYYWLSSPSGQQIAEELDNGSVQPNMSVRSLQEVRIPNPPLSTQRAIAGILGALDDKIELNRRMNQTLESVARAVFSRWFVENEEVADWEVMSIEHVAERVAMGPFGSSIKVETFVDDGIPIISGQHLRSFMLQDTAYNFISLEHAERLKKANVQRGDIIFTHAGNVGNLAFIPEDSEYDRYVVSQRQFYMRCNMEFVTPTFITFYFQSPEGQHKLLANMSSVGVPSIAQPVSYLRSIELPIPPKPVLDKFEKIVSPLLKKYRANEKESRTLASLRDTLLPRLMRGEVRVRDVCNCD